LDEGWDKKWAYNREPGALGAAANRITLAILFLITYGAMHYNNIMVQF
jgi:hypothetical protein